jgi:hypothetical protein
MSATHCVHHRPWHQLLRTNRGPTVSVFVTGSDQVDEVLKIATAPRGGGDFHFRAVARFAQGVNLRPALQAILCDVIAVAASKQLPGRATLHLDAQSGPSSPMGDRADLLR